jgi:hypothetical protein
VRRGLRESVEVIFGLPRRGLHAAPRILLQETTYLIHPTHKSSPHLSDK